MRHKLVVSAGVAFVAASTAVLFSAFSAAASTAADLRLLEAVKRQDSAEIAALVKARVDVNAPQPTARPRCIGRPTTTMPGRSTC